MKEHNDEFYNLHFLPDVVKMSNSKEMERHVERMGIREILKRQE
jgi:hypothetical protein